jgi:hypothetical protein
MNAELFREFLERIGHKTIESETCSWYKVGPGCYASIPPFDLLHPGESEIRRLLLTHAIAAVRYCTDTGNGGKPSFLYVVDDPEYDLGHLSRQNRGYIKRAAPTCRVEQIDFEYLYRHGMPLNQDTVARQNRDDPMFTDPSRWKQVCEAGKSVEGAFAWGTFVEDALASFVIGFLIGGTAYILYHHSANQYLNLRPNHLLTFTITRELMAVPEINCVSLGYESIRDLSGLDDYKLRLGYTKRPLHQVVRLHPLLKGMILGPAGQLTIRELRRRLPDNDTLLQVDGLSKIASYSYGGS